MSAKSQNSGGYLIEYIQNGLSIKVTAIDPKTGLEVSMVGSSRVSQAELNRLAVRKLEYVLAKQAEKK